MANKARVNMSTQRGIDVKSVQMVRRNMTNRSLTKTDASRINSSRLISVIRIIRDVLFEIKDLEVSYGSIAAIKGISLEVHKGEIVTILGANGAGKTTTMRTISQLLKAKAGSITLPTCSTRDAVMRSSSVSSLI